MAHVLRWPRPARTVLRGMASALTLSLLIPGASAILPDVAKASNSSRVTVSVSEIHNNGECLDGWPFENVHSGCSKADYFAIARIVDDSGNSTQCGPGPVTRNFDNVVFSPPDVLTGCSNRQIDGSFTVTLEVWDADDTNSPPQAADQADLTGGNDKSWRAPFTFGPGQFQPRTFTISGGHTTAVFTVALSPMTTTLTLATPAPGTVSKFDPVLGETLTVNGRSSLPTRIRVTARAQNGGSTYLIGEGLVQASPRQFVYTWDGRVSPGALQSVSPGKYDIIVQDLSPSPASPVLGVAEVAPRPPGTLAISRIYPKPRWSFRNGPLSIDVVQSTDGFIRIHVFGNDACSGTPIRTYAPQDSRAAGVHSYEWDGKDANNALVSDGTYCMLVEGTTLTGQAMAPDHKNVVVVQGDGSLEVAVGTDPATPFLLTNPGGIRIVAEALTNRHAPREAASFTVEVSAFALGWLPQTWAPQTFSCTQVSVCIITVPPALTSQGAIAYRVSAAEADGIPDRALVTSSMRLTETSQASPPSQLRVYRVNAAAKLDNGMVSPVQPAFGIDVIYYPGTGYDLASQAEATAFSDIVRQNVRQLLGVGPAVFPSSVMDHFDHVSIYAALNAVRIDHTGGASPTDFRTDLCVASGLDAVSFGDVHGLLHTVGCRDNASFSGHWFTANAPTIGWHEFHHAAYGEADEYCCDGGYSHGVNLYGSLSDCQRDGSNPQGCNQLTGTVPGTTTPTTLQEWRSDTDPNDVMIFNLNEDADDRRAAERRYPQCDSGLC